MGVPVGSVLLEQAGGTDPIGERKHVDRIQVILVLLVESGRLGKAVVEEAEAAAGDVGHEAVEDLAILFVRVEAFVDEMPQEAPALRDAETDSAIDSVPAF